MKTKISTILLFAIFIVLSGCNNKLKTQVEENTKSIKKINAKLESSKPKQLKDNLCSWEDAVIDDKHKDPEHDSKYDTEKGKATLWFKIPKDHELEIVESKTNRNENELYYESKGESFGNQEIGYKTISRKVEGLKKVKGEELDIELVYIYNDSKNKCPNNTDIQGEKKNESTVGGQPFSDSNTPIHLE